MGMTRRTLDLLFEIWHKSFVVVEIVNPPGTKKGSERQSIVLLASQTCLFQSDPTFLGFLQYNRRSSRRRLEASRDLAQD
jgi:hypothetical protein